MEPNIAHYRRALQTVLSGGLNLQHVYLLLFSLLDKHQLKDSKKMKFCDHIVVNNKSLFILKKKLSNIIELYE